MPFLDKFDGFNRRLSGWFEWVGLGGLLVMMTVTCIDVVGAKIFRSPLYGALDIVVLAQMVAVSFATAFALVLGRHVSVEFFMMLLPERLRALIETVISFFGLLSYSLCQWV